MANEAVRLLESAVTVYVGIERIREIARENGKRGGRPLLGSSIQARLRARY